MRVLIVSSIYPTPNAPKTVGGAEIFARQFAESLVANGDGVEVIRAATQPDQAMETCHGIDVHSAPVRNIYSPFTTQRSSPLRGVWHVIDDWNGAAEIVTERIERFKPDVLQSNTLTGLTTGVWVAARKAGLPIVHTLHDYYLTCPRCSRFADGKICTHTCLSCRLLTVNRRKNAACVDAVVGVSQRILDIHKGLGLFSEAREQTVIRNAPLCNSAPVPRSSGANGKTTFGFIGRLTEEKGIYNLVQAFAEVPSNAIKLVIAGRIDEGQQHRIRAMAAGADIQFLGFVDPAVFYDQIDVVVIPSVWEDPAPLVLVEAWAAGKPVLGTPFGGMAEIIKQGSSGWITNPDPTSLAASIKSIAADRKAIRTMSDGLLSRDDKRSLADVVNSYRELFALITKTPSSPGAL